VILDLEYKAVHTWVPKLILVLLTVTSGFSVVDWIPCSNNIIKLEYAYKLVVWNMDINQ